MHSLIDYIGIKGAPLPTPESGEYINRLLPGLPMEAMVKVTDADQESFLEQWQDIQKLAAKRFNTRIISEFQKRYQIYTLQRSIDLLKAVDKTETTGAAPKWRGFTIELTPDKEQLVVYSALQCLYVQSLRLYRNEAGAAIDGAIFDLRTGEKLKEFEFPAATAAGWTTVKIEERYTAYRLFCAYDGTILDGTTLDITASVLGEFGACACELNGDGCYSRLQGAQADSLSDEITDDDLDTGLNTYGLSGIFALQCSYEPVVAQNREIFLLAWAYTLGWGILWTRINSSTINRWTIGIDKKRAEELMTELEVLFDQEIQIVLDGVQLNLQDCCLECNAQITTRPSLL